MAEAKTMQYLLIVVVLAVARGGMAADKVWSIAVGHDWGAMEYIDENGYLAGFQFDLISEVCEAAGMQCRTVWEPYNNCWDSEPGQHSFGGKGLIGGWYDACTGWIQTIGRHQVFDFSMPFLHDQPSYFYVKVGSDFDPEDLTNRKIGFLDGWWTDEKCLARMTGMKGVPLPVESVFHYATTDDLKAAMANGEIDAGFAAEAVTQPGVTVRVGGSYVCSMGGSSMMTRKDNGFNTKWNKGFQTIMSNGRFRKLCKEAKEKHADGRLMLECV